MIYFQKALNVPEELLKILSSYLSRRQTGIIATTTYYPGMIKSAIIKYPKDFTKNKFKILLAIKEKRKNLKNKMKN